MSQLTYLLRPDAAIAGQLANSVDADIRSAINKLGNGAIPFAIAMAKAAGDPTGTLLGTRQEQALALATDAVDGIVLFSDSRDNIGLTGSQAIKDGDTFNLLTKGDVWVVTEQTVTSDDPVYVRIVSDGGANLQPGTFRKDIDAGRARKLSGARWIKGAAAAGIALLRFNADSELIANDTMDVNYDQAGNLAATTSYKIYQAPANQFFVVDEVDYDNPTGFAVDPNNYWKVELYDGAALIARWWTQTGQEGALVADTFVQLTKQAAANLILKPGDIMTLTITKVGAPANFPAGRLIVHGHYIG